MLEYNKPCSTFFAALCTRFTGDGADFCSFFVALAAFCGAALAAFCAFLKMACVTTRRGTCATQHAGTAFCTV